VETVGFKAMLCIIGVVCLLYSPFLYLLKNPPVRSEQEKAEASVIKVSYGFKLHAFFSNW